METETDIGMVLRLWSESNLHRNQAIQTLADIHLLVMGRKTPMENEIADLLEGDGGFTSPREGKTQ